MTREQWLEKLAHKLRPMFKAHGAEIPYTIRYSCGWMGGRGKSKNRIGECWSSECSADNTTEIFISPKLSDEIAVAETLVHELVHAAVGCKCGHKGEFKRVALALGLTGKMTATSASADLTLELIKLMATMTPYPHAALEPRMSIEKQKTRMLKVTCPACDYTVRTTAKWLDVGLPVCPCGEEMEAQPAKGGDGE